MKGNTAGNELATDGYFYCKQLT